MDRPAERESSEPARDPGEDFSTVCQPALSYAHSFFFFFFHLSICFFVLYFCISSRPLFFSGLAVFRCFFVSFFKQLVCICGYLQTPCEMPSQSSYGVAAAAAAAAAKQVRAAHFACDMLRVFS